MQGMKNKNFRNFLIVGDTFVVDVCCYHQIQKLTIMFRKLITPAITGRTPYGSGADKSLNQKNPSVNILDPASYFHES